MTVSDQLKDIMAFCGYDYLTIADGKKLYLLNKNRKDSKKIIKNKEKKLNKKNKTNKTKRDPNSPFAVLKKLL